MLVRLSKVVRARSREQQRAVVRLRTHPQMSTIAGRRLIHWRHRTGDFPECREAGGVLSRTLNDMANWILRMVIANPNEFFESCRWFEATRLAIAQQDHPSIVGAVRIVTRRRTWLPRGNIVIVVRIQVTDTGCGSGRRRRSGVH